MPDFNYQNVFVDKWRKRHRPNQLGRLSIVGPRQGGLRQIPLTGILSCYAYPDLSGTTQIPPLPPLREHLQENPPAVLQDQYLAAFTKADPVSAHYTRNSHLYEVLEIAISAPLCRGAHSR